MSFKPSSSNTIQLNLPGLKGYEMRLSDGLLACDLIINVDNVCMMGNTFDECKGA